jgi:hypothetical protein
MTRWRHGGLFSFPPPKRRPSLLPPFYPARCCGEPLATVDSPFGLSSLRPELTAEGRVEDWAWRSHEPDKSDSSVFFTTPVDMMERVVRAIGHTLDMPFTSLLYSSLRLTGLYRNCGPGESHGKHMGPKLRDMRFQKLRFCLSSDSWWGRERVSN